LTPCRYYQVGSCSKGKKCPFAHGKEELAYYEKKQDVKMAKNKKKNSEPSQNEENDAKKAPLFEYRREERVGRNRFSPGPAKRSRSKSRSDGRRKRARGGNRSRSRSLSSSKSRKSPSRTVLQKSGKGDWLVKDAAKEEALEEDDDSQPLIFECLTEKEKVDLEKAHSLVEFAQSCLDSDGDGSGKDLLPSTPSPFLKAYDVAMNALKKLRNEIRAKQKKLPRDSVKAALAAQQASLPKIPTVGDVVFPVESATASNEIDYLEATTSDASPLNVSQVEAYFSRFGALMWCLQAVSNYSVIFKYHEGSLYKMTLEFNHMINGKPIKLQGMRNGGVPVDSEAASSAVTAAPVAAAAAAAVVLASPAKSTLKDDAGVIDTDYLSSLRPEQFARYINSLR